MSINNKVITANDLAAVLDEVLPPKDVVGEYYSASAATTITNTDIDSPTNGASITLPAGSYIVRGEWHFVTRTTTGTTNSQVALRNGASGSVYAMQRVFASGNNWNSLQTMSTLNLTETTTVYVCGSTSRPTPTATSATNWISAFRIK